MSNKQTSKGFSALAAIATKPDTPNVPETKVPLDFGAASFDGEDMGDLNDANVEKIVTPTSVTKEGDSIIVNYQDPIVEPIVETPVVTLNDRSVRSWTEAELEAYIAGAVDIDIYHSTVVEAIQEMRIRNTLLPAAWSLDDCKQFLSTNLSPAQTSKGAWVKDVTRAARREHEWTNQELESWALGEIKAEGSTIDAGLAIELKSRLGLVTPTVDVDAVILCYKVKMGLIKPVHTLPTVAAPKAVVAKAAVVVTQPKVTLNLEGINPMAHSYIEDSLADFHKVMAPGRSITNKVGGEAQKLLKEIIAYAYSLTDPTEANTALRALFEHFAAHRGEGMIFEDTYAFRFIEDMNCTPKEQIDHSRLLTAFLAYADPLVELRAQTDVGSLIGGVPTRFQSRVIEFFSKL